MANIFREALGILGNKNGGYLTDGEEEIMSAAMIPWLLLPKYNDVDLREGLAELARMVEEAYEGIS